MERGRVWSLVGSGILACLSTGCILHQPGGPAGDNPRRLNEQIAMDRPPDPAEVEGPPLVPPPSPPSDYRPQPVPTLPRAAGSAEPCADAGAAAAVGDAPPPEGAPPSPPAPEPPLVAALRCSIEKHPQEARQLLEKYGHSDRELLVALLRLFVGVGDGEVDRLSAADLASTLDQLTTLTAHLRRRARLSLERVCFCRTIGGFGQFEPLPAGHEFQPGSEGRPGDRVHVYAELKNFASRPNGGQFETTLASSLEVFDLQNRKVAALDLGSCVDRCQTRRQDYFLNVQFHVPADLPAGFYTLKLTVRDQTPEGGSAARVATRSLDFHVGSAPLVARP